MEKFGINVPPVVCFGRGKKPRVRDGEGGLRPALPLGRESKRIAGADAEPGAARSLRVGGTRGPAGARSKNFKITAIYPGFDARNLSTP